MVDLKAAIKYLKYNSEVIPGNMNRIISNGTSAGGAMSTLLGATGNSEDYLPYLLELGAAQAPDNIFAVSAYCPITNLDNADGAYEWQFNGVNTYQARMMRFLDGQQGNTPISNELSPLQIKTSNELKVLFPLYINSLELSGKDGSYLTLDMDGEGSFKDLVIDYILQSANKAIGEGKDLSGIKWISLKDGKAVAMDFGEYVKLMQRMKTPPAFDAFDMDAPENHLFGTVSKQAQHFTDFSFNNSPSGGTLAQKDIIKMMNPMYYIGAQGADNAKYWHIRYGTIDNNTSLAIELILALWLEKYGHQVDFEFAWDRPHMGDYDLDELFEWMDIIVSY